MNNERFWSKVARGGDEHCWEWTAHRCRGGYGGFQVGNRMRMAHRVSWTIHNGQIPRGMMVCHSCDNPPCVNPSHLFLGTAMDNVRDKINKGRHSRKISEEVAVRIYQRALPGVSTQVAVAREFGVSARLVSSIVHGERWAHLRLSPSETKNYLHKLTDDMVRDAKASFALGESQASIARRLRVSQQHISKVVNGHRKARVSP